MKIEEYEKYNIIDKEPEFVCWVPSALKFRKVIIIKAEMRVRNNTKFGIAIPVTQDEAIEIDIINGNTYSEICY